VLLAPWHLIFTLLVQPCTALVEEDSVQVTVVAILATDKNDKVDEKLERLAREIRKKEPKLKGFRLARVDCKPIPVGQSDKFALVDDEVATITVQRAADKNNQVRIKVKVPRLGAIVYTSVCGKFFPIVTRYWTKDGERLIVALMVGPCKDDD
jgi:hypothetical protein